LIDIQSSTSTTNGMSSNIWILDGSYKDTSVEGIKVNYSVDVHFLGNTVSNTGDNGIDTGFNRNAELRDNALFNTGMPNGAAVHTDSANGVIVIHNYINGTGESGIAVHRASNITVEDNTIIYAGKEGITIITSTEPSSNIVIDSNHIISPGSHGIFESQNQLTVKITNNQIEKLRSGYSGVLVVSPNPTTTVSGNVTI